MKNLVTISAVALLLSSASALAQEAPDAAVAAEGVAEAGLPAAEGTDIPASAGAAHEGAARAPGVEAEAEASASFTEAQIDSYVTAAIEVQEMQADTTLDDAAKQERASAILAQSGLDPRTFNAISDAVQTDPEIAERVQLALANRRGSPGA